MADLAIAIVCGREAVKGFVFEKRKTVSVLNVPRAIMVNVPPTMYSTVTQLRSSFIIVYCLVSKTIHHYLNTKSPRKTANSPRLSDSRRKCSGR